MILHDHVAQPQGHGLLSHQDNQQAARHQASESRRILLKLHAGPAAEQQAPQQQACEGASQGRSRTVKIQRQK